VALGVVAVAASFWMESWDRLLDGGRLVFVAPGFLGGWRVNAEMSVHLRQVGGGGLGVGVAILIADLLRRAGRRASPPR